MKPTVEIATASKPLIRELRSLDTHNRARKPTHVEYLRREIRAGRFSLTNQGIGVTVGGWICDGGHRLEAIELEGCPPVQFILARNLPDTAQKYVDQHSRRSMADTLTLFFDTTISCQVIAALNMCVKMTAGFKGHAKPGPDRLIQEFEVKQAAMQRIIGLEKSRTLPAPVTAALIDVLHMTADPLVINFAQQVIRGEMLQTGDPALTLRNWLNNSTGGTGGDFVQRERYLKTRAATMAFLEGRRMTKLYATPID